MPPVTMRSPDGTVVEVPEEDVAIFADRGYTAESAAARSARVADDAREEYYSTPSQKLRATYAGVARGATLGLSDAAARLAGADDTLRGLKEANPELSLAGEIGGALLTGKVPLAPAGIAARAGSAIAKTAEGASVVSKLGRAAAGAAVEGAIYGAGSGVSEVSLSQDPVTLERAISTIGSNALFGAGVGGAVGAATAGAGAALRRGKQALDDMAAKAAVGEVDDVTKRAFVDEVKAFRKATVDDELFLVAKGAADRETKTLSKTWLEADKALDKVLRNPKALASKPDRVLTALQQQEHALEQVVAHSDDFAAKFAADTSPTRMAALQKAPAALEANRALQAKIAEMSAKPAAAGAAGLGANMLGGQAFGLAAGVVGAIPGIGPMLAPLAGAAASKLVTEGLGKAMTKQAARMSKAVGAFLTVGEKIAPVAPVLGSKVAASLSYGNKKSTGKLADDYKARIAEVKAQTEYGPDGRAVMRADARQRVYDNLAPIRVTDPVAADRMETLAARRIEAIANRVPRKPDIAGVPHGPDRWQASDMEARAHLRFMAAVEDPAGIVERLAAGTVTPEDASAMREVYPEMYAQIQTEILAKLPTLRATLPYQRRLALSIFSGVPVDASMDPKVLGVLQQAYADESEPVMPSPQFGSVKNHEATPSQDRQGVTS